jgi:SAM-dependent methyltransferase
MADPHSTGGRAPLRFADWRFLLPHPPDGQFQRLVLLGGPVGLAERVIEVGLARHVSHTIPLERSADAVIVLHGARAALREIARCLLPSGVLYCEIDRRSLGFLASTPDRIRRSIRKVGLFPTAMYAVVPDFSDHRMYLPLDIPGALRWYVTTLYNAFSPWQYLLKAGLGVVTGLDGRRFAPFAPRLAVTAVAGQARPSAPSVLEHPALPPELQGLGLRPLLLTYGGDRVVMLPFAAGSIQPAAVLKVPKLPGFNGRTENEQATLRHLWSRLDPTMRRSIPRSLGTLRCGEVTVGIESYAPGQLLFRSSERWGASRQERLNDLRLAAAWLGEFHLQAQVCRPSWGASESSQWVEGPFDAYRRAFGITGSEERLFAEAREYAISLTGTPLPIVLQHRDFTVWNIARFGRQLGVLDWEGSRPGPALCDLLHFVTHWYEIVRHAHHEAARQRCFRRLLFEPDQGDPFCEAVHHVLARYMERLDMNRRFFPLLLVYTWVELALRRSDQQRLQEETYPDPRDGNRNFAFLAILAEHVEQLFAEDALAEWPRPDDTTAPPLPSRP